MMERTRRTLIAIIGMLTAVASIMVLSFAVPDALASGGDAPALSMTDMSVLPGETFSLDLCISGNPGIIGATVELNYDSKLSLIGINNGTAFQALEMTKPGMMATGCRIHWDTMELADEDIADGTIATLIFVLSDQAIGGDTCFINVVSAKENGQPDIIDRNLNNIDLASAQATVTAVASSLEDATIEPVEDVTYTGSPITPQLSVTLNGTNLQGGTHYSTTYANAEGEPVASDALIAAGSYTATITGTNGYVGSRSIPFTIARKPISVPVAENHTYDGNQQAGVTAGEGYELSGDIEGTDAGSYVTKVTPDSNHIWTDGTTSEKECPWTISKADISRATIDNIEMQTETGRAITPEPTIMVAGRLLDKGIDYELSYENNLYAGTGTVRISGIGNYDGSAQAQFAIIARSKFVDVTSNPKTSHYEDVLWLADCGITTGYTNSDGTKSFQPFGNVTRQDMAAFLFRLAKNWGVADDGWQPNATQQKAFRDVNEKTPHAREVWWLASTGISQGWTEKDGSKTFRPSQPVARQDMAAFLFRLTKLAGRGEATDAWTPSITDMQKFVDVTESTPHAREIWWMASKNITTGWRVDNERYEFKGLNNIVRCDMAAFLHRLAIVN